MGQRHQAFTLSDGTVIFDVLGAEGEDDDEDEDEDDESEDSDDEESDEDEDEEDSDKQSSSKKPTVKSLQKDLDAALASSRSFERRMKAADRDKMRIQTELDELKKGGKKELSEARSEIERLRAQVASQSGKDKVSIVRDEFLSDDTYGWQNRKVAFGLLDLDEVEVSDKGKIDRQSLKDAVEQLAKDHPYLVKAKAKQAKDDDEDEDDKPKTPSGRQPQSNRRRQQTRQADKKAIEARYPILQGRV